MPAVPSVDPHIVSVSADVIALALPNLDFVISLLGVFCLSMLGITFPALMEVRRTNKRWYDCLPIKPERLTGCFRYARSFRLVTVD